MKREVDFNVLGLLKQQLVIKRTVVTLNTWHTDVWVSIISASSRSSSSTIRRSSHYFCILTIKKIRGEGRGGSAYLRGALVLADLSHARSARSREPWVKKSMRPPFQVSWVKFPLMYHFRQKGTPFIFIYFYWEMVLLFKFKSMTKPESCLAFFIAIKCDC